MQNGTIPTPTKVFCRSHIMLILIVEQYNCDVTIKFVLAQKIMSVHQYYPMSTSKFYPMRYSTVRYAIVLYSTSSIASVYDRYRPVRDLYWAVRVHMA
jgi:hypothetical protein